MGQFARAVQNEGGSAHGFWLERIARILIAPRAQVNGLMASRLVTHSALPQPEERPSGRGRSRRGIERRCRGAVRNVALAVAADADVGLLGVAGEALEQQSREQYSPISAAASSVRTFW